MREVKMVVLFILLVICATGIAQTPAGLEDFQECILLGGGFKPANIAIVRLGKNVVVQPISVSISANQADCKSRFGRFYILYDNGELVVVNGKSGEMESKVQTKIASPFGMEILSETEVIVSSGKDTVLRRIDSQTGEILGLAKIVIPMKELACRHMLKIENRLYVAISCGKINSKPEGTIFAVVDLNSNQLIQHQLLFWQNEKTGEKLPAINPLLPLVFDREQNRILIGAKGVRPRNTGMTLKVDLGTFSVKSDSYDLSATFNGHRAISFSQKKVLVLEHTSTPVSSTHVMQKAINDHGDLEAIDGPAILDLFEETDDLSINGDGTLAMIANSCPTGFAISGKGLNLIDVRTGKKLPKIMSDTIGFAPEFSVFLQP
ncbi:MAG: hypothetical protein HQM10_12890 [Candidatus Riflebacteria bacterium]|nr:hypothetical protein [Candidatus Riflebacteria bacterium]